ncbi:platelet endothelial aggregation receptor 1-like, partial [Corapipo altera]|uniref:platelet endothelial aggregation receptor 1-like n=1 Tax=Corapipo altera TaxID=415028 RepID=UPI000FD65E75
MTRDKQEESGVVGETEARHKVGAVVSTSKLPESSSGPSLRFRRPCCAIPAGRAHRPGQPRVGPLHPHPASPRPPARMLLRAAVLAVHAALLAALRPSDPNVCSYWESFTAAVKESYTKPHVVSSSEPCPGGLGSPLPCPQQRVVHRTEYRQAVRTDYRRRYQCCLGYYESRDTCVREWGRGGRGAVSHPGCPQSCLWTLPACSPARCSQECVHGRCVAPELCQCEPGWRGPDCSSGEGP